MERSFSKVFDSDRKYNQSIYFCFRKFLYVIMKLAKLECLLLLPLVRVLTLIIIITFKMNEQSAMNESRHCIHLCLKSILLLKAGRHISTYLSAYGQCLWLQYKWEINYTIPNRKLLPSIVGSTFLGKESRTFILICHIFLRNSSK